MNRLFLYHNGRRGEVLLARSLCRAVLATGTELVLGACRGDGELLAGLGPRCRVVESEFRNTLHGAPLDLRALCPADWPAVAVRFGVDDRPSYQWADVVASFHRDLRRPGLPRCVAEPDGWVPMLDFAGEVEVPALRRPSIYLDTERTANDTCWFVYDLQRLARVLPDWDLLCTTPPAAPAGNLVDISRCSWPQRSRISERCDAVVGTTMDPFVLTLTEQNRWKPKAICGYDARVQAPFWDYPGNPLELLATMDELVDFLVANVAERSLR